MNRSDSRARTSFRLTRAALVVLAVGQVVSGALVSTIGNSVLTQANRPGEPTIVPAGYAFSIWGVIELVSVGLAVWFSWFTGRASARDSAIVEAVSRPLLIVFAGFSVWLVASVVEPVWATVAVFLVMGFGLVRALSAALAGREQIAQWSWLGRALVWSTVGLYAGWSTVALWINLTTALAFSGAPVTGTAGVAGQLAILAGVTATATVVLRWTRGSLFYAAAVAWALVAAILGAAAAGSTVLAAATGAGLVIVLGSTVVQRLRRRPGRVADVASGAMA